MVIDCFSKYVFTEPLKRKTTEAIIAGMKKIFGRTDRRPERIQTDKGGEYESRKFRKFMKDNDIIYNTTRNPETKCSIAERVIRTLKTKIFKYLTYANSFNYINVLDDIVESYNNGYHRTIKMAPSQVNDCNILQVYENITESQKVPAKQKRPKIKVGDYVRITKERTPFTKGYLDNWTEEVFKVKSIVKRKPIVYYLVDLMGEEIDGTYYEAEVQKVNFDEGAAKAIESIIKQRRRGKSIQYYVKWQGWPDKFNSWIPSKAIISI